MKIRLLFLAIFTGALLLGCNGQVTGTPIDSNDDSDFSEETTNTGQGYPAPDQEPVPTNEQASPAPDQAPIPTNEQAYPAPDSQTNDASQDSYPAPGQIGCDVDLSEPQNILFETEDGIQLTGKFYPPGGCAAPIVLLFHQFGSSQESWSDLAAWIQNRGLQSAESGDNLTWLPEIPEKFSAGVFIFDFRNHGQSGTSDAQYDPAGFLLDAQAAFNFVKSFPNIDPNRIVTIGASIGADASVDVCLNLDGENIANSQVNKGCLGALQLSPGNYLNVPYGNVVNTLLADPFNMLIHCVAAEGDGESPALCETTFEGNYESTVYGDRSDHGTALLQPGLEPDMGELILNFLMAAIEK